MKKVAVITTDYNNHSDTDAFLGSSKVLDTKGLEVLWLVVDNGSDTSPKQIIDKHPGVTWLQTGKNIGFAGGFNRGLKYAYEWGANYSLIINNDTLFGDRLLLKNLIKTIDNNPNAGLVSPKIYFAPQYEFYKERYSKSETGKVIWYAGGEFDWDNIRSLHRGIDEVDKGTYDNVEKIGFVSGCCMLVTRKVIEKAGFFEDKLFAYYEDADWLERIKKAGFEFWYYGKSHIFHKVSRTAGIGSSWSDYLITRNRLWFGMKYAGLRTKFALIRESIKLLAIGRSAQREGILDYIFGIWGWKRAKQANQVDFPLELSVVVINYKTTQLLLQLLSSILNNQSGFNEIGPSEILVLDNSPDESCSEDVLNLYPNIKFIANKVNNGFAAGNNQLINYSLGRYILLLNSDIEAKHGSIKEMMITVKKLGEKAMYSGKLFFPNGENQDSCFSLPNAWRAFQQYFLNKKGSYFMYAPQGSMPVKVEGAVMACFLIPRWVINKIGSLSEATFMYFEDIEYCRRARQNNIPIYFVPQSEFIHHHGQASKKAGSDLSTQRMIKAAKWYHGWFRYQLLTAVLWAGQKWGRVITPESRWKKQIS